VQTGKPGQRMIERGAMHPRGLIHIWQFKSPQHWSGPIVDNSQ
jgi:hypothetical protein